VKHANVLSYCVRLALHFGEQRADLGISCTMKGPDATMFWFEQGS